MPAPFSFSVHSTAKLDTCDPRLIKLFNEVIKQRDCTVTEGHRDQATQDELFRCGKSQKQWPDGNHCSYPSRATDVMPCPINYHDRKGIEEFAAFVLEIAQSLGIKIRWGGDWNQNGKSDDEKFFDGPHYELSEP